ncbi:MAG: DUF2911 domain-containing protein, partial [Flavobacterium sp.]
MRKLLTLFALSAALYSQAQVKTPAPSPKATIDQVVGLTDVEIVYSRPSMKGRTIFGDLVPFGKTWRTGANANTTISFSEDVVIDGKTLKKGKYALYTVPKAESWDIIFYSTTDNWGTPETWQESNVALRASAKTEMLNRPVETFTIALNNLDNNYGNLELSWEKTLVSLRFNVPTAQMAMASIDKALGGPTANDYFAAAQYYYQSNGDSNKALAYVNKAIEMNKEQPFFYYRQKSLIQARLGDKKGAIETAKVSLAKSQEAKNMDYVKMNQDSISEWSRK